VLATGAIATLDPHAAYDNQASMLFLGAYEMLLRLKGESTSEFTPMLAESWERSEDQTTYTFRLAPDARFVSNPNQMTVLDPAKIQFSFDRPKSLFLAAIALEYGPLVLNATPEEEYKTKDDPFAPEWFAQNIVGTGPYRMTENEPNSCIALEWFDSDHGGWAGNHFDHIVMRIVEEGATRRHLLESGEADAAAFSLTPEDVTALQENPELHYPSTAVGWAPMNAPRLIPTEYPAAGVPR
jgi:peptide/nickel transport system substrate-binding protein